MGVSIGRHSYGFENAWTFYTEEDSAAVSVGHFCSCALEARILPGARHTTCVGTFPFRSVLIGPSRPEDALIKGPIKIGHDVWIGYGATILSGVTVGHGSIVGARAVVTKSFPPYSLIAGNPASLVKRRFSEEIISELLSIAWWDWPDEKIVENIDDFYGPIDQFIEKHRIHV